MWNVALAKIFPQLFFTTEKISKRVTVAYAREPCSSVNVHSQSRLKRKSRHFAFQTLATSENIHCLFKFSFVAYVFVDQLTYSLAARDNIINQKVEIKCDTKPKININEKLIPNLRRLRCLATTGQHHNRQSRVWFYANQGQWRSVLTSSCNSSHPPKRERHRFTLEGVNFVRIPRRS